MNLGLRQSNMFVGMIKLLFLVTVTFMIIIHVFITSGKEIIEQTVENAHKILYKNLIK